jgi:hypothetical protein
VKIADHCDYSNGFHGKRPFLPKIGKNRQIIGENGQNNLRKSTKIGENRRK